MSMIRIPVATAILATLCACVASDDRSTGVVPPLALRLAMTSGDEVAATYSSASPAKALHFAQELGGYRAQAWRPADRGFRWVAEGAGERIERADGKAFVQVGFVIPVDYRALPKSYAPFSPFSDGSTLIHSGQFHACLSLPCTGADDLPITVIADGDTIRVGGSGFAGRTTFTSDKEGTNVFVGALTPVAVDGFVAIIDPGLPEGLRRHLRRSLPQAMRELAQTYGLLSFRPELYVSIDSRPETSGHESTQGGTLPNQVFMHFDGAHARERLAQEAPWWLDWFFAHEAAHLFQQDRTGKLAGDNAAAWLHEGAADAMAALALVGRGVAEQAYVAGRVREAEASCAAGLAGMSLAQAGARRDFDLQYRCGLLIWLALDEELRTVGADGLADLNRAFFAKVRAGQRWNVPTFAATARDLGASAASVAHIDRVATGDGGVPAGEIERLGELAGRSLARHAADGIENLRR